MSNAIEVRGAVKRYGSARVLDDLSLDVPAGGVTAILGASGSGKTTLLRLLAGFDALDAGTIHVAGRLVDDAGRTVSARHRGVGYVPQDAALFPHLSVAANIGFGVPRQERRARVAKMLDLVDLPGYQRRYPHQLSGGQQQRVALARALAIQPQVVLLDEPFGALDSGLRESVRGEVLAILAEAGQTVVLVTHDQDEALSSADEIALLGQGRIHACDTPQNLYLSPPDSQIASAIGIANVLPGTLTGAQARCALGIVRPERPVTTDGPCQVMIRPEMLALTSEAAPGAVSATVTSAHYHGHDTVISLAVPFDGDQFPVVARCSGERMLAPGDRIWVAPPATATVWAD